MALTQYLYYIYRLSYFILPLILFIYQRFSFLLLYTLIISLIHLVKNLLNYYLIDKYQPTTHSTPNQKEPDKMIYDLYIKHFNLEDKQSAHHIHQFSNTTYLPKAYLRILLVFCILLYLLGTGSTSGLPLTSLFLTSLYLYLYYFPSHIQLLDTRQYCGNLPLSLSISISLYLTFLKHTH